MDNRLLALLEKMIEMPALSYWELGNIFEMPISQVKKDIQTIEKNLKNKKISNLVLGDNGYEVLGSTEELKIVLNQELKHSQIYLTEKERLHLIYLYTFSRTEILSNFHYQYFLSVSKNTIISDIKKVNKIIVQNNVAIQYSRSKGYYLFGKETDKRAAALYSVSELLNMPTGSWQLGYLLKDKLVKTSEIERIILELAKIKKVNLVNDRLEHTVYFLSLLILRLGRVKDQNLGINLSSEIEEGEIFALASLLVKKIYPQPISSNEVQYLTTLLLGISQGKHQAVTGVFKKLTNEIIEKMETIAVLNFTDKEKLFNNLYAHLVPAYYRLVFGNTIQNDLTDYIKYNHLALFELVREALTPLSELAGVMIPEDEISYFTIHFGGQIEAQKEIKKKIKALIICPNGISASLILKTELQNLFPQFEWLENHSMFDTEFLKNLDYDLVFSTIYIGTNKPLYVVKPIMDNLFKQYLVQKVSKDFHLTGYRHIEVKKILSIIDRYATIHDRDKLEEELFIQLLPEKKYKEVSLPVLKDILTEDRIQIKKNNGLDWQEAIRLSGAPLLSEKAVEPEYMEAIIKKVKDLGPFIDLGSGIAIPHARPEEGVNKLGMSILKLDEPVNLLDDEAHAVSILIFIAATDNHTHLRALSQLTKILVDTEKVNKLKSATKVDEIMTLINEGSVEEND